MKRVQFLFGICALLSIASVWALVSSVVEGAVPQLINFQGILRDGGGNPVADGSYSVAFKIYDAPSAGNVLWTETQFVTTSGGFFNVLLGATNAVPDSAFNSLNRYLGIAVASDLEMSPRFQLVSVGYAYRVNSVDGALGGTITSKVSIGSGHTNTGANAFVAGGSNTASGDYSAVSGGIANVATAYSSTIGGGEYNNVGGRNAVVGGGLQNTASARFSTISGGRDDTASGDYATVGGGVQNTASGELATVAGGGVNTASGNHATVGGGLGNKARGISSVVCGGNGPTIADSNSALGDYSFIGGGRGNVASGNSSVVAGGQGNRTNQSFLGYSTVSGGISNIANTDFATVGGGQYNNASGYISTIGGGIANRAMGSSSTIAGGDSCTASGDGATVGGGEVNVASGFVSTVSGGAYNSASGAKSVVGGGEFNSSSISYSTVSGGWSNVASNERATVGGGGNNTASGRYSTVPGGNLNTAAGGYSFAVGRRAKANQAGVFVWADSTDADFASTGANQFLIRATGGVGIGTNSPEVALQVDQDTEVASFTGNNNQGFRISGTNTNDRWVLLGFDGGQGKNISQIGSRQTGTGSFLSFGTSSAYGFGITNEALTIDPAGNIGMGVPAPAHPLHLVNGAHCTAGGTWTNASSRSYKTDIQPLKSREYAEILEKLENLEVVRFRYKIEPEREHIGLIAEEVPDEMASVDRKGIPTADAIAFLTAALKAQQSQIENLKETVRQLQKTRK